MKTDIYSLHRRKAEQPEDRAVIPTGTRSEVLEHFMRVKPSDRPEYFAMLGGLEFNHLELENMARDDGLQTDK